MKSINISNIINKLVYIILLSLSTVDLNAAVGPGGRPVPPNPIDMYEGTLLIVAIVMMVGYYLYTRNRKAIA